MPENENPWAPTSTKPTEQIHRAILAATKEMPLVAKTGTMELGGKSIPFTKIDDIRAALYPVMERHGLNTYMTIVDKKLTVQVAQEPLNMIQTGENKLIVTEAREVRDGRIPTTRTRAELTVAIRFVFVGDNSEVTVEGVSEAYDTNGDKATNKATTAAVKRIFQETFHIVDRTELDIEGENPEDKNRASTTDRREGGDRGSQQREAAQASTGGSTRRSGPQAQRSVTTNARPSAQRDVSAEAEEAQADPETGELPEPAEAPELTELDRQKARVRAINAILNLDAATVNAIATEATGKAKREDWITLPTAVKKVADALEARLPAEGGEQA